MIWKFLRRQRKSAHRAQGGSSQAEAPAPTQSAKTRLRDATLLITHAEVCDRHGTGALLGKIFEHEQALLVLYSRSYFDSQSLGTVTHHLPHPEAELEVAKGRVAALLSGHELNRIFCVPFYPDDALSAFAAEALTSAPLVTYIMDDQNLFVQGIADPLMKQLLERSSMRFAISEPLRAGYEQKFGYPFWIIPPVNSQRLFASPRFRAPNNHPPKGVIIGNVWNLEVLQQLRELIKVSGLTVEWYGNAGKPFIQLDPAELANEGIILHENLADDHLSRELRRFDYGIVPSGSLNGTLEHDWLFRASLPSRVIYMMTTAHLPLVVLGDPQTVAGSFVDKLGLGVSVPYRAEAFREAVREITESGRAKSIRRKAADLSPAFASDSLADWIWQSARLGKPLDDRYERVFENLRSTPADRRPSCVGQLGSKARNSITGISMLESLRHKTTLLAQRGLAIDALHRKLDVALGRLEALEFAFASNVDNIDARARRFEDELRKLEEHFTRLNLVVKSLEQRFNERLAISEPWLPEEHFVHSEPEYYLAAFLHNFLPNRVLLDVGANVGDFTEVVSDSGYRVYAFEPFPATFERLKTRMAHRDNVKTFNVALGSTETTLPLYVASEPSDARQDDPSLYNTFRPHFVRESLVFAETVDVPVRTIESLVKSGEVPEQIDFLKVDTEGFDLEVVRGLGNIRPSVVQTEFWGDDFLFVRDETNRENFPSSAEIISELRNRDFFWNIIVFRMDAENCVRFGTNLASAPKKAWGNMLFLRDHNLFLEALRWCQGTLPRFQALASGKFAGVQRD